MWRLDKNVKKLLLFLAQVWVLLEIQLASGPGKRQRELRILESNFGEEFFQAHMPSDLLYVLSGACPR